MKTSFSQLFGVNAQGLPRHGGDPGGGEHGGEPLDIAHPEDHAGPLVHPAKDGVHVLHVDLLPGQDGQNFGQSARLVGDHHGLDRIMERMGLHVDALDALALAEEAGSSKAVNLVLMGRLSHYFDIPEEAWMEAIAQSVPEKFLTLNQRAFQLGRAR